MKVAIISDIHGNLEALKATLKDIEKRKVDKIICLGDIIAKGFHQKECLDLVRKNCDVIIRGNCDRHFSSDISEIKIESEEQEQRFKWNQSLITDEDRKFLMNLPYCYEFNMSGSLVRMFHATPTDDKKAVIDIDDIETRYNMFLPSENTNTDNIADVVIYGHIHNPGMSKIYNKTLINVGSVGNAFDTIRNEEKDSDTLETTRSCYLILEGEIGNKEYTSDISFQFVKVPYDIEKELKESDKMFEKDSYIKELRKGIYRNMAKVNENFKRLGLDINKF